MFINILLIDIIAFLVSVRYVQFWLHSIHILSLSGNLSLLCHNTSNTWRRITAVLDVVSTAVHGGAAAVNKSLNSFLYNSFINCMITKKNQWKLQKKLETSAILIMEFCRLGWGTKPNDYAKNLPKFVGFRYTQPNLHHDQFPKLELLLKHHLQSCII